MSVNDGRVFPCVYGALGAIGDTVGGVPSIPSSFINVEQIGVWHGFSLELSSSLAYLA
jgi:hypothetical protein